MSIHTHNFKVPDSLYHLKDNTIRSIIRQSEKGVVELGTITNMLLNDGFGSVRVAKSLSSRIDVSELVTMHNEFKRIKSSNVIIRDVCYMRERNFITVRYEVL